MWSSRHKITRRGALLGALSLAGCGFVPAYGTNGPASALRGQISITAPDTVAGFRLRTHLEDRLGLPQDAAAYTLRISLRIDQEGAAISTSGATTRFSLAGEADYRLIDNLTGAEIAVGQVDSFTAYSTTGSTVATESARNDAVDRLAVILGDLIITRLLAAAPGA